MPLDGVSSSSPAPPSAGAAGASACASDASDATALCQRLGAGIGALVASVKTTRALLAPGDASAVASARKVCEGHSARLAELRALQAELDALQAQGGGRLHATPDTPYTIIDAVGMCESLADAVRQRAAALEREARAAALNAQFVEAYRAGRHDDAEMLLERALEACPRHTTSLVNFATFLQNVRRDYAAAEEYYVRAVESSEDDLGVIMSFIAFLRNVKKDNARAHEYFLCACASTGDRNAALQNNFAQFLRQQGDLDGAEARFLKALELAPDDPATLNNFAMFLKEQRSNFDAAESYFRKAVAANPPHAPSLNNFAQFLRTVREDLDAAEEFHERAADAAPEHPEIVFNSAQFLAKYRGRRDEARARLERALRANPKHPRLTSLLSELRAADGGGGAEQERRPGAPADGRPPARRRDRDHPDQRDSERDRPSGAPGGGSGSGSGSGGPRGGARPHSRHGARDRAKFDVDLVEADELARGTTTFALPPAAGAPARPRLPPVAGGRAGPRQLPPAALDPLADVGRRVAHASGGGALQRRDPLLDAPSPFARRLQQQQQQQHQQAGAHQQDAGRALPAPPPASFVPPRPRGPPSADAADVARERGAGASSALEQSDQVLRAGSSTRRRGASGGGGSEAGAGAGADAGAGAADGLALFFLEPRTGKPEKRALGSTAVSIGRKEDNDLSLLSKYISRYHGRLDLQETAAGAGFVYTDLESSGGTKVNGRRVLSSPVRPGDVLKLGKTLVFVFARTPQLFAGADREGVAQFRASAGGALRKGWTAFFLVAKNRVLFLFKGKTRKIDKMPDGMVDLEGSRSETEDRTVLSLESCQKTYAFKFDSEESRNGWVDVFRASSRPL